MKRLDGRLHNQMRSIKVTYDICGNADGSVLFELGNTKVLCSVMLQDGVPTFLKGKGQGWLTAEYTMLPSATTVRTVRESSSMKRNGRSVEISRLIGRTLRSIINFELLKEKTLYIDCDVIQADGGTRTAAISGSYCALYRAMQRLAITKKIAPFLTDSLAAVSLGLIDNTILLDIDFQEDSCAQADFNFVMTGSGLIVEVQGAAEKTPLSWDVVQDMHQLAKEGIEHILTTTVSEDASVFQYAKPRFVKTALQDC